MVKQFLTMIACVLASGGLALAQRVPLRPATAIETLKLKSYAPSGIAQLRQAAAVEEKPDPLLNTASAKVFTAKIQPILSNVCSECHAQAKHSSQYLLTKYDPNYNLPEVAEANLKNTLKWLNLGEPGASPLLTFAVQAHGAAKQPPLRDAQHPAYRTLEAWAWGVSRDAKPTRVAAAAKPAPMLQQADYREPVEPAKRPMLAASPFAITPHSTTKTLAGDDPFDPNPFNQSAYPNRK